MLKFNSHCCLQVSPFDRRDEADEKKRQFSTACSDHLTVLNAYKVSAAPPGDSCQLLGTGVNSWGQLSTLGDSCQLLGTVDNSWGQLTTPGDSCQLLWTVVNYWGQLSTPGDS